MSEYLSKKAVLEWLNELAEKYQVDEQVNARTVIFGVHDELFLGRFDTNNSEVQRLRAALEELQHLVDDEEGMHIINQALSTSEKEELAEIREFYRYHPEDNMNKLNVNFLLSELDRKREEKRNLANIGMNIEREIRSLIKDLDECDQPYEDIYDEIIKLVNKVIIRYAVERQKLIEGLQKYIEELGQRFNHAYQNYSVDSDHHQLGMAEAYDIAENRLRDILKEIERFRRNEECNGGLHG